MLSVAAVPEGFDDAVDTVKSRALRADEYGVSDGFGGYSSNEPGAGVPFLPKLAEPPPRPAPLIPNPAVAPGVPGVPGAPAGASAGAVATMERFAPNPAEAPNGEMTPEPMVVERPPRRTPMEGLRLFVNVLPVLLLMVLVAGGAWVLVDSKLGPATLRESGSQAEGVSNSASDESRLPRFSSLPPSYGTATFHMVLPGSFDVRITMNRDGSDIWMEYLPFSEITPGAAVMTNAGARFERDSEQNWELVDVQGSAQLQRDFSPLRQLTFRDVVPDAIRPYTTVQSHEETFLSGRELDSYALTFDVAGMRSEIPDLATQWMDVMGVDDAGTATDTSTLTVWVDNKGVIWKVSTPVPDGSIMSWTLEYLGPEEFTAQFPTTYYNAVNGEQVNG